MKTIYFVSWYIHNKTEDAWNATIVDKYDDLSAAKKSYHEQLAMYINGEDFDSVVVLLTDSYGNKLMGEWWTMILDLGLKGDQYVAKSINSRWWGWRYDI